TARAVSCGPAYEFIGARGSGESPQPPANDYSASNNYGMGAEISSLYGDLVADTGLSTSDIAPFGVRFNAIPVTITNDAGAFLHLGFLGPYNSAVAAGR